MQSARCCIVILLCHGLAQKNLHAGSPDKGCGDGKPTEVNCFCGGNRLAREVSWPSQALTVYLRRRTEDFHV
jgi:hypothetical protein